MTGDSPARVLTAAEFLRMWRDGAWGAANTRGEWGIGPPEPRVAAAVAALIEQVRARGREALLELTARHDGVKLESLEVSRGELVAAAAAAPTDLADALALAAGRIRAFAVHARDTLLSADDLSGATRGVSGRTARGRARGAAGPGIREMWCPLQRVGVYAPGGRAAYASSVLMAAVPARVAGAGELVLCTPPAPGGACAPGIAAAALLAGVDRVFRLGGVQAMAAMALGAGEVPRVDKIAGPGGQWVTEAKRQLFGEVGLDGLAGPSEVVAVSNQRGAARFVAGQLVAQAEHDPLALALALVMPPLEQSRVLDEIRQQLGTLPEPNRLTAAASLSARGAVIAAGCPDDAAAVVEAVRPEHLWVDLGSRSQSAAFARRAAAHTAAVFIGPYSAVAMGDYVAGPSHVLPTGGTARWASPLGVVDFMRRVSWVELGSDDALALGPAAAVIARHEGFNGHARSLQFMGYRAREMQR